MTKRIITILLLVFFLSSCATIFKTHHMDSLVLAELVDGTYIGQHSHTLCGVKLVVTLKEGRISDIIILNKFYTYPFAMSAYGKIPRRIIEQQSLDVDAVTMATVSSNGIKQAVLDALEKARTRG